MPDQQSFLSIPLPTKTFLDLVEFLREHNSPRDPVEMVRTAVEYWLDNAAWKTEDLLPEVIDHEKGFRWKQLYLPHSTLIRMKYRGGFHYAKVVGDKLLHDDQSVSPSEFAHRVTGTARNAWRDLEVRRPGQDEWILADLLRPQTEGEN